MTDDDQRAMQVGACECGHVHVAFQVDDDTAVEAAFTVTEAREIVAALILAIVQAENALRNLSGGDAGPCTKH